VHEIKAHGGVESEIHSFLTLALDAGQWSGSSCGHFTTAVRYHGGTDPLANCEGCKSVMKKRGNFLFWREIHVCPVFTLCTIPTELSPPTKQQSSHSDRANKQGRTLA